MLVSIREPCTAQRLAGGLGWTLPRTVHALERLEQSLANTGQILNRVGHHNYTLGPRPGLLHSHEIARCQRHNRDPLDLTAAALLHQALTRPRQEQTRLALRQPAESRAAERLIAAGLLEEVDGALRPTPRAEATFQAPPDPRWLR